jgi:putative Mg2+ transporter-C (MgtC) family protein
VTGVVLASWCEPAGQGWAQIGELALAFALSAVIGLEQEIRHRSAGLRTHTLVGCAAALIVLMSKYGFTDVLGAHVVLDSSRVAAQIVSGIGFIGAGLIFVRRDAVRVLTTAASIWLTAAVGMAAGAGLSVLALVVTMGYFLIVLCFTPFETRTPASIRISGHLRVDYADGRVTLQDVLAQCADLGFTMVSVSTDRHAYQGGCTPGDGHRLPDRPRQTADHRPGSRPVCCRLRTQGQHLTAPRLRYRPGRSSARPGRADCRWSARSTPRWCFARPQTTSISPSSRFMAQRWISRADLGGPGRLESVVPEPAA